MKLIFNKTNYILLLVGVFTIVLGLIIMTLDKEPYGFGFLGLTLGPLVLTLGFAIEFAAILYQPKTVK